jgi:SNF2 family DNA or RNA helicase
MKAPIKVSALNQNLFKLNFINSDKWYYLPDVLIEKVSRFIVEDLFCKDVSAVVPTMEWTISQTQETDYIKANLYNKADPSWHLRIADDLKKQFVKTIHLTPEISINKDESIDWFVYKVTYKYHDLEFTQDELRRFFDSGKKFLTASDGSNISFANREIFDEIEDMLSYNKKDAEHFQKLAIYRLPWIFELKKINPAITIYGDEYLNQMYTALQKRSLSTVVRPQYHLDLVMRSYQKAGFQWLKLLEKYKLNGILADDMGLGKTLQAISILSDLDADSKSLILCPKTLLFNWAAEIEKFNPHLKYLIYEGGKGFRTNLLNTVPVQIILCSYSLIQNDLAEFSQFQFDYVILDEAQHIKNHRTMRSKAIKKIKARHKLAMTGTPLENSVSELWSIFDFLMPGYMPPLKRVLSEQYTEVGMHKLKQYIAPFILRRKKQDVLIELPDKQEQVLYCKMTEKQEQIYVSVLDAIHSEFENLKKDKATDEPQGISTNHHSQFKILAALTRLRQICNHPALIDDDFIKDSEISGKIDMLHDLISDALQSNRKILIFSQFVKMLRIIEKMVKKMNVQYEYMDGSTKDRKKCINHFNNNEKVRLFLISLKTGGFGINLTAADTVILVDPWWNPMVSNQAIDRVHRMGQTKKVLVYKMITIGSVEEKILLLQKKKKDLFESVIESGEAVLKGLDFEDIKQLFEYKK